MWLPSGRRFDRLTSYDVLVEVKNIKYAPVAQLAESATYNCEALTRYMEDRTLPGAPNNLLQLR